MDCISAGNIDCGGDVDPEDSASSWTSECNGSVYSGPLPEESDDWETREEDIWWTVHEWWERNMRECSEDSMDSEIFEEAKRQWLLDLNEPDNYEDPWA